MYVYKTILKAITRAEMSIVAIGAPELLFLHISSNLVEKKKNK